MDIWDKDFDDDLYIENYEKYTQDNNINSFLDLEMDTNFDDPIFCKRKKVEKKPICNDEKAVKPQQCIPDLSRQPNSEDQNFFSDTNDTDQIFFADTSHAEQPIKQENPAFDTKKEDLSPFSMNRIPQPRIVQSPKNSKFHENQSLRNTEAPKYRIDFSENSNSFKQQFYSIFLNNIRGKNIFPKEKVIVIHNSICVQAGVRRMRRDEYRAINNYFKHFAKYKNQILKCIIDNKEELSSLIDLPSIIEKANTNVETRKKLFNFD